MHRATLAAAQAVAPAIQFEHHSRDIAALGNAMAVATVGAANKVGVGEMSAHAGGDRFFAGVKMNKSGHLAGGKFNVYAFFELADPRHGAIGREQFVAIELHRFPLPVRCFGPYSGT